MEKLTHFVGQRVVITGGTSGIGYELVRQLSPKNEIHVVSRSAEKLARLKRNLPGISIYHADLSQPSDLITVAKKICDQTNQLDVLINNAAVQNRPAFLDTDFSYETIAHEIALNFTAVCSLCHLLLPALRHDGKQAVIANINSGLALSPKTTSAVYCATKGAINIFSQSLGYQLEDTNIRVMQAFLPLVDTAMTKGRSGKKHTAEHVAAQIIKAIEKGGAARDIGKVSILRLLTHIAPVIAKSIMKRS